MRCLISNCRIDEQKNKCIQTVRHPRPLRPEAHRENQVQATPASVPTLLFAGPLTALLLSFPQRLFLLVHSV